MKKILLVALFISVVVTLGTVLVAPVVAQEPYVPPVNGGSGWVAQGGGYNTEAALVAQGQWGEMSPYAAQKWADQATVEAWNAELAAEIAAKEAAQLGGAYANFSLDGIADGVDYYNDASRGYLPAQDFEYKGTPYGYNQGSSYNEERQTYVYQTYADSLPPADNYQPPYSY